MPWTKPDFQEISLCMEVTAYVNTDDAPQPAEDRGRVESPPAAAPRETPA
jgi:coenzyme PQQ precursor peptide PqqA